MHLKRSHTHTHTFYFSFCASDRGREQETEIPIEGHLAQMRAMTATGPGQSQDPGTQPKLPL